MSKQGTSRSRSERNRGATSVVVPISNDIVPGKFTEHDLNSSIEQENVDEYIFSIIDNIIQDTQKQIKEKYLKNRIVPFTVDLAKNAMLKIIEWNFLCHDKGELDKFEDVWIEDQEPESCTIDSWAQGYFPKRQASFEHGHHPTEITEFILEENSRLEESEEEADESYEKLYPENLESETISAFSGENDKMSENKPEQKFEDQEIEDQERESLEIESREIEIKENDSSAELKNIDKDKTAKPKRIFKPYRGKLNFDDLHMLTETLSETEQRLEIAHLKNESKLLRGTSSRSATSRQAEEVDYEKKVIHKLFGTTIKNYQRLRSSDILLNTDDQLVSMMKIPISQLTAQRVKANYKTLDAGAPRANIGTSKDISLKQKSNSSNKSNLSLSRQDEFRGVLTPHDKHPLPVSMLDSIDPVPGVIVQEGDRIKKSTNKKIDREIQMEREFLALRPVKNQPTQAAYMIEDIININQVNIKPISPSTPIPPITSGFKIYD